MTPRTIADHIRPSSAVPAWAERPIRGILNALTRSPISPSSAGRSDIAASTETMPTRIAPVARLRRIVSGTSTIPNIASTNARPLKTTARLAVRRDDVDRGEMLATLRALLAEARDHEQRVVDPEREPHAREHVHGEDRELEHLAEKHGEAERDDDRDDRHQDRHETGHDRPEDEQQDDERHREPELELSLPGDRPARAG